MSNNKHQRRKELSFQRKILIDKELFLLGCETGLLTRERLRSKLNLYSSITFLHKSFQEYCAAWYLADLHSTNPDQFHLTLNQIKPWQVFLDKFELLKFSCGVIGVSGLSSIIKHAIKVYKNHVQPSSVCVGFQKPEDNKKNIIPILSLLYESQVTMATLDDSKLINSTHPHINQSPDKTLMESMFQVEQPNNASTITSYQMTLLV